PDRHSGLSYSVQSHRKGFDQCSRLTGHFWFQPKAAACGNDRVLGEASIPREADVGHRSTERRSPSSAESAMTAGIDRIYCHVVAHSDLIHLFADLQNFAGELVADHNWN